MQTLADDFDVFVFVEQQILNFEVTKQIRYT